MTLACFNSASFVTSSGLGISVSPTVEVRREDNSALASIFSDEAGTTPITNPSAFADSVGRFKFYAAGIDRGYSILVTKGAESFTLRNVGVGTAGQRDATAYAGTLLAAADAASARAILEVLNQADISRPNLLTNGNWLIDQILEGTAYTINVAASNAMDGWSGSATGVGVFGMQQVADPDNAALKACKITCNTADASIAAGDAYYCYTAVEGYDSADLKPGTASPASVTLVFAFKSNVTGVYGVSLANSAGNRSQVQIITVPDTDENTYSLTFALDTTGTWLYTNGVGLYLRICLAAGSTFQKAAGSWGADNMLTTSAQANFMSVNTNVAYLKRIQLIPGTVVLAYGPQNYQKELAKVQRGYWKSFAQGTAPAQGVAAAALVNAAVRAGAVSHTWQTILFPVPMRATPTGVTYNPAAANAQVRDTTAAVDCSGTAIALSDAGFVISDTGNAATGIDSVLKVHVTANARLS